MAKATRKHVYLYDMHIEVLDEIISTHEDISNYSEAVRHLCMMYDPKIEEKINPIQIKLNAMGKEISINRNGFRVCGSSFERYRDFNWYKFNCLPRSKRTCGRENKSESNEEVFS